MQYTGTIDLKAPELFIADYTLCAWREYLEHNQGTHDLETSTTEMLCTHVTPVRRGLQAHAHTNDIMSTSI